MSSSSSTRVRTKVVALLVSLVALWAFAAFVTLRDGLNLLGVSTLDQKLGRPTDSLLTALQKERRLSLIYLGDGTDEQRAALAAQRALTDEAKLKFQQSAHGGDVQRAANAATEQRVDEALERLDGLTRSREAIDARRVGRMQASATFTDIINAGFRIYSSIGSLDDPDITKEGRTLQALTRARDVLSQEDALLAGVLATGRFTGTEHEQFVQLVGAQRFLYAEATGELPVADRARYEQLVRGPAFTGFRTLEDLVVERGRPGVPMPVDAQAWKAAVDSVLAQLRDLELSATDSTIERAKPVALGVIVRLMFAGVLGLIAVIASIVMSITTTRSLVQQLDKLRSAAWCLATERLPHVVERLRRGEKVDVATEAPPLTLGSHEIGQLGQAFNAVQQTAVRVAVEQAELRQGIRDVFLSLARRTQALVHRQLSMLDSMERRETKPEELEDLFRVDHLATRMRRNAENLIVLSGAAPGRGWRNPVPLVDVVRGAVAEVEDYERVTVLPIGSVKLAGRAVGDVIHLLAELIENAASFSPPYTGVQVGGQMVANGFAFEIEDRGLGMSGEDQALANENLRNPPDFNLSSTAQLGLYVVARLAQRHGIRVQLRDSPYGGMTAIVLIPRGLVLDEQDADSPHSELAGGSAAAILAGNGTDGAAAVDGPSDNEGTRGEGAESPAHPASRRIRLTSRLRSQDAYEEQAREVVAEQRTEAGSREAGQTSGHSSPEPRGPVRVSPPAKAEPSSGAVPHTPSGLPRRVRRASLAARPRSGTPADKETPEDAGEQHASDDTGRTPEEVRRMMASYQKGTIRGRLEAEQLLEVGTPAPRPAEPVDQAEPSNDGGPATRGWLS